MSKQDVKYKQCSLQKETATGYDSQVSWIPSKFATVGTSVKLKNDNNQWEGGWKVLNASDEELALNDVPDWRKAIRSHRRSTGDSLDKV